MPSFVEDDRVAIVQDSATYPKKPPFDPSEPYPEWGGGPVSSDDNPVYRLVRQLFYHLNMDEVNFGNPRWNPLGTIIQPGNTVVLKPNLVAHYNHNYKDRETSSTDCLVTHGSVIRAVLDYVAKALQGHGKIIVMDSPIQGTDWEKVIKVVGLPEIRSYFRDRFPGTDLSIKDARLGRAIVKRGEVIERIVDGESFANYTEVDLGARSLLIPLMRKGCQFGVTQYPKQRRGKRGRWFKCNFLRPLFRGRCCLGCIIDSPSDRLL